MTEAALVEPTGVALDGASRWHTTTWQRGLVLVAALALAAGIGVVDARPVGVVHDDAMYVILARSLAAGQGYRFLNIPGRPAATHFPPGYPALLAAVSWIAPAFPANVMVFKALNAVFLAVAAVGVAVLARRVMGAGWAFALGVASALSVPLLILGSMVLSEPLFLALLLVVLLHLESFVETPSRARGAVLTGVAIAACTLVRTHGIVLLPAVVVALVLRRRVRDAVIASAATVGCLLPWQYWSARHSGVLPAPLLGNYDSYASWWVRGLRELGPMMIPHTVARTSLEATAMFGALFSPLRSVASHAITVIVLAAFAILGTLVARKRLPVTLLFVVGYAAIVAAWPFTPARFVWGVWPLALLLVIAGPSWALSRQRPLQLRIAAFVTLAWVAGGYAAYEIRAARGEWWSSIARANTARIVPLVRWTAEHTRPSDVVATDDEGAVYLYTGRRTVPVFSFTASHYLTDRTPEQEAREGLRPILAAYPVTTVLAGTEKTLDVARLLTTSSQPRLALREEFPGGVAFTVLPQ